MRHTRSNFKRMCFVVLSSISIVALLGACGAGSAPTTQATTPAGAAPAVQAETTPAPLVAQTTAATEAAVATQTAATPPAAETTVATEVATSEATATTDVAVQAQPTPEPTPLPEITCQPGQKEVVWMPRSSPLELEWVYGVAVPDFQKAHPDLCLRLIVITHDEAGIKRQAMIAAGEKLHVWDPNYGGDGFASDRARGLIQDLTPLIQRDNYDLSGFIPDVLKVSQSEGKTWALPFLTTGAYIYYNKKLFDEANVPYPPFDWEDQSWTWANFIETAKKLTKNIDDPNNAQYGAAINTLFFNIEWPPGMWGQDIWPEGTYETGYADEVFLDTEQSIQAYQAFHDAVYKDKVAPDPATEQALNQLGGAFSSGRTAMQISGGWGHWAWKDLINDPQGFCWGAAPMPIGAPGAKLRSVVYTDPWAMTAGMSAEDQDLAWTLIKFLVSPEQIQKFVEATGTPPTRSELLNDYFKQFEKCMNPEDMRTVFEGAFPRGRESSNHMMVRWDELRQVWDNVLSEFWSNPDGKAADVMPTLDQQTTESLQRIQLDRGQ